MMDSRAFSQEYLPLPTADPDSTLLFINNILPLVIAGDVERVQNMLEQVRPRHLVSRYPQLDANLKAAPAMTLGIYIGAAGQNGIPLELVSILARKYIAISEHIRTTQELEDCLREMMLDFTGAVHQYRLSESAGDLASRCWGYICTHIYGPVRIADIAAYCGYSVSGLQHAYKEETGCSLGVMIRKEKRRRAEDLLLHTRLSVQEISDMLGYRSPSQFISFFKSETGKTPGAFRTHSA
jgi:AraC-like DNA-binding protein